MIHQLENMKRKKKFSKQNLYTWKGPKVATEA